MSGHDERDEDAHDTPPFGVDTSAPAPEPAESAATAPPPATAPPTARFEIRDRLIELDDLRQRHPLRGGVRGQEE